MSIQDHRLEHIHKVNKSSVGDELRVGLINGNIGTGRIILIDEGRVEMDVVLDKKPPASLLITLVLAMVRAKGFQACPDSGERNGNQENHIN